MSEVQIPIPEYEIQKEIGGPIIKAYELKEKANTIEQKAVESLENILDKYHS